MKKLVLVALCAAFAAATASAEPRLTGTDVSIPRGVVGAGGGALTGGLYLFDGAAGEGAIGAPAGGAYKLESGVVPQLAQPGTVTAIVAATKSTGTLELTWTAPGLDGLQGAVGAGSYRLDWSSDSAHVFAPTTFQTEFATTCAPGQAQSYNVTGLLANTTYYARVYLSDARKFVAETSTASAESTLARVPPNPSFTGVFATSVTISWTIPTDGAEGYKLDASTTNFGQLFPGGVVTTSQTPNGLAVTLTVGGLTPYTSYFFTLASLNWQSETNYSAVLATRTLPGGPIPVLNLASQLDALGRAITLTWTNPYFANQVGATVVVSTNPITFTPSDGTPYALGSVLSDGSVVASTAADVSHLQGALSLDTTAYFRIYSKNVLNEYSVAVATSLVLDLPPLAAAGLQSATTVDGASVTLTWAQTSSNLDGSAFKAALPDPWELDRYDVYRATSIARAGWTLVGSTNAAAGSFLTALPVPGQVYYYKVVPRDAFPGGGADQVMAADTLGNLYAVSPDNVTRLKIPAELASFVTAQGNPSAKPLIVRASERPGDLGGRIVKSVQFRTVSAPDASTLSLSLPSAKGGVDLHYETAGGLIVPSALGPSGVLQPAVGAAEAPTLLSAYYAGANDTAAKLFGRVDPLEQTVHVDSALLGTYQIRTVLRDQAFSFDLSGVSNKAITPNGDGLNDTVVFTFDNPKDSLFSGRIFDIRGALIAEMKPGPLAGASLMWDGRSGGVVVPRGVYIYQIKAEGKTFNGTVVVIR